MDILYLYMVATIAAILLARGLGYLLSMLLLKIIDTIEEKIKDKRTS